MKKYELKRIVRTCWCDDFRDNYGKKKGVNYIVEKILKLTEEGKKS